MEGTSLGGELVLVSACLTVSPLITGGQAHTHTIVSIHGVACLIACLTLFGLVSKYIWFHLLNGFVY
jgi:hypothetical protein